MNSDHNIDEHGEYNIEYLSMLKGGPKKQYRVYTYPVRHLVLDQDKHPQGWYHGKYEEGKHRPRTCYTEATLSAPYGGTCTVGCRYCYVNDGIRGYQSSHVSTVDPQYPEKFAAHLKRMKISGAVYITPFNEPFNILEDKYHNTERLTEAVVKEGLPLFYTTKRIPPDWAVEALLKNPYSYIHFSINTSIPNQYKAFSPGAAPLDDLMQAIRTCNDAGIFVGIQCNPIHVGITSIDDVKWLVDKGRLAGAKHFIFKFVEKVIPTRDEFLHRLRAARLSGVDEFEQSFNQVIGGVYTTHISVRIRYLEELLAYTRSLGVTIATCHEYYEGYDIKEEYEGNAQLRLMPLGPWFTTSDQCHGRGVPLYFRPEGKGSFQALPGCYRKGCLWCEDYGTKACDDWKLQQARALEYVDFRTIVLSGKDKNWKLADSCFSPDFLSKYKPTARWSNRKLMTDAEIFGWG